MRAAGWAIALGGAILGGRSALLLAGRGRPRRGTQPAFVLAGPYLRMRNPLLAGVTVTLAGLALALGRPWIGAIAALVAIGAHLWVVRVEEPRLRARFGSAYAAYVERVPRWIPRLRTRSAE